MNSTRAQRDLQCLDRLIADFGGTDNVHQSKGSTGSLHEHLQAARRYLLGSMAGEYSLSLRLAKESVASLSDKTKRTELKTILRSLIDPEEPKEQAEAGDTGLAIASRVEPVPAH
jgi:hypothetical protein